MTEYTVCQYHLLCVDITIISITKGTTKGSTIGKRSLNASAILKGKETQHICQIVN